MKDLLFNLDAANKQALRYTIQVTSSMDSNLSRCESLSADLNERGFVYKTFQVGAKTTGQWTGKIIGGTVGAAPGAASANPPLSMGGLMVGQKYGGDYGEFLADYATESVYHQLHTLPLENKLKAEMQGLQQVFQQQMLAIQGELKKSGASVDQQEYVLRQVRQNFQYQPHFNLLDPQQKAKLNRQVQEYDQSVQYSHTAKLTESLRIQGEIFKEQQSLRQDFLSILQDQSSTSSEILHATQENQNPEFCRC